MILLNITDFDKVFPFLLCLCLWALAVNQVAKTGYQNPIGFPLTSSLTTICLSYHLTWFYLPCISIMNFKAAIKTKNKSVHETILTWCFPPDHCPKCSISSTNSLQAVSENMGNQNTSGQGYRLEIKCTYITMDKHLTLYALFDKAATHIFFAIFD